MIELFLQSNVFYSPKSILKKNQFAMRTGILLFKISFLFLYIFMKSLLGLLMNFLAAKILWVIIANNYEDL